MSNGVLTPAEIVKKMRDPLFRIEESGIYWIVTKEKDRRGRDVSKFAEFVPFEHQKILNRKIFKDGLRRVLIPKARRTGVSTDINICQFDQCLNKNDFHSRIVDMSEDDAKDKLVNRVTKSWDRLDSVVDTGLTVQSKSGKEISWSNGSRFTASISGRGGDAAHFLHVSELGPIDFKDPKRADEIIEGAFPAADGGIIIVESTAKGPLGHFKRLCDYAMEIPEKERTKMDWQVLFFPWYIDPRHVHKGAFSRVDKETKDYLDQIEGMTGQKFSEAQRLWYYVTKMSVGRKMKYEYPSLLEECWQQPVEGAIYADDINRAREDGRIGNFPHERGLPVYTIWDLGSAQNTRCICFQLIQGEIRIINAFSGGYNEATRIEGPREPQDWAKVLRELPYSYASHILPHDGNIKQYTNVTYKDSLLQAGLFNVTTMAKRVSNDDYARINPTWGAFNRFVFNTENHGVKELIDHLCCYHTKKESDGVSVRDVPNHNFASHYAEAFSSIIEAIERGFCGKHIGHGGTVKRRLRSQSKPYSAYA